MESNWGVVWGRNSYTHADSNLLLRSGTTGWRLIFSIHHPPFIISHPPIHPSPHPYSLPPIQPSPIYHPPIPIPIPTPPSTLPYHQPTATLPKNHPYIPNPNPAPNLYSTPLPTYPPSTCLTHSSIYPSLPYRVSYPSPQPRKIK